MKGQWLLIALGLCACNREPERGDVTPAPTDVMSSMPAAQSKALLVVPMPKEQAELDRMILAGYTPHGSHLHPPGVKNCPLAQDGNEAVM